MGRRTSGQQVGIPTLGNVQASGLTLTTTQPNSDLTLDPNGTGAVVVNASVSMTGDFTIQNQGDLRLSEASGNGTNYIAMQAASSMAANYTLTWPAAVTATAGFFLASDGSGNLSWASAASGLPVGDSGSTSTVHYPFFGTSAGSVPTSLTPLVRANLSYVPSTGDLRHPILTGGTGASNTLTIRGTTDATKASASVLMTDGVASTNTTTGTLVVTGGVGISGQMTATSIVETSSITLKENINPIENALDAILKLSGVTYDRTDTKEHEAGLIAEWVDAVLPNLVTKDDLGNTVGIKYTKLTAYLIESIKTLKQEVDSIKGQK